MYKMKLNIQLFAATATITNARNGNYSIENNNETQRLTFTVKRTSGTTYWQDNKTLTFTLRYYDNNNTQQTLTQSVQFNFPSGAVGATKSTYVDFTVPHKTDGTQSITYEASIVTGTSVGTLNPTGSATLETIPRASSITVNDANIGSATNIVINKASSSFTTTLWYRAGQQTTWNKIVDKTSNQVYGWTVPTSFYSLIPNAKTISCQFYAETYSGSTLVGTSSTVSATFTATGNPIINSITLVDTNTTCTALTGDSSTMIKYASNVQVTVSASRQNEASITSITINGSTATLSGDATKTGVLTFNLSSTNTYTVVVTDSRGYQTSETRTMTMVNYIPLTINAVIERNQPTDGKVNISYSGNYYNGSFGSQSNSLTVQYRYIEKGDSWTGVTWNDLSPTITNNTYAQSNYQLSNLDYQKQYEFQIRAIDKIYTSSNPILIVGINVLKGQPIAYWDEEKFGTTGKLVIPKSSSLTTTGIFNEGGQNLFNSLANNNCILNAAGANLFLGYQNTQSIIFGNSKATLDADSGYLKIKGKSYGTEDYSLTTDPTNSFQTTLFGSNNAYGRIKPLRLESNFTGFAGAYGSGLAVSTGDTHMYLHTHYSLAKAFIGAGNADKIKWYKELAFKDDITTGSNTNGSYIKFPDGTMICYQRFTVTTAVNINWGQLKISSAQTPPNFPTAFTTVPSVTMTLEGSSSAWLINGGTNTTTSKPGNFNVASASSLSSTTFTISIIAIGK